MTSSIRLLLACRTSADSLNRFHARSGRSLTSPSQLIWLIGRAALRNTCKDKRTCVIFPTLKYLTPPVWHYQSRGEILWWRTPHIDFVSLVLTSSFDQRNQLTVVTICFMRSDFIKSELLRFGIIKWLPKADSKAEWALLHHWFLACGSAVGFLGRQAF